MNISNNNESFLNINNSNSNNENISNDTKGKSSPIVFWRGVTDPNNLMEDERVSGVVLKLLNRDYAPGDFEKLRNHDIYSIRTNRQERLLFNTITIAQKKYLLVLDFLENHEYSKSKFLKPAVLKKFCIKQQETLSDADIIWENNEKNPFDEFTNYSTSSDIDPRSYSMVDYHGTEFIKLNTEQGDVLRASTPLIVNGAPGSGKSCAALSSIVNYLSIEPNQNDKKVLYVCSSKILANTMQKYWEEQPCSKYDGNSTVTFISYADLIKTTNPDLQDFQLAAPDKISSWFNKHFKKLNNKLEKAVFTKKDQALIFEEFQILSVYDENVYYKLGKKQSLFKDGEKRKAIWSLYTEYTRWLKDNALIDPRFFIFPQQETKFDLSLIDEAADLSPLAVAQLYNLTNNGNTVFFLDTHQDLHSCLSKRIHFKKVLQDIHHADPATISLPHIYRCPKSIIEFANRWLDMKTYITGGISDKEEYREIEYSDDEVNTEGGVHWIEDKFAELYDSLRNKYKETEIAIVAEDSEKFELSAIDPAPPLIFTPLEIKGLEFPIIIVYKPFEGKVFREINNQLKDCTKEALQKNRNRSKKEIDLNITDSIVPEFNKFFTSITRTQRSLFICQENNPQISQIKSLFLPILKEEIHDSNTSTKETISASEDDWLEFAKKLYQNGNIDQFNKICQTKLDKSPGEILKIIAPGKNSVNSSISGGSKLQTTTNNNNEENHTKNHPINNKSRNKYKKRRKNKNTKKKQKNTSGPSNNNNEKSESKSTQNDINRTDNIGYTQLLLAVHKNRKSEVKSLIKAKADVNATHPNGQTPLHTAAYNGYTDIVKILVKNNADINALMVLENSEQTPLWAAFLQGQVKTLKYLIEKVDVDFDLDFLLSVCEKGYEDVLKLLINRGIDLNRINEKKQYPLLIAVHNNDTKIVKLLLENGANINITNDSDNYLLYLAITQNNEQIVKLLLDKGDYSRLSMHLLQAQRQKNQQILELLTNHGAKNE